MSVERKRKHDTNIHENENKRLKNEFNLQITDDQFNETDYQTLFQSLAYQLINFHELIVNENNCFRLCEIEFYFHEIHRHPDTFTHRHPDQMQPARWYFHRQSLSATANYRSGTYKGLDITLSSLNNQSYGGILIRSIENKQTNEIYEGSCIVVDRLLQLTSSETIKELVEVKLNKQLDIFQRNSSLYLRSISFDNPLAIISSPRVGLTLKMPSIERERFLFRSYRFTPLNYYPTKMKMTIILSQAADNYFQNSNQLFVDSADQLSIQTKTRLALVKTYLHGLQDGFQFDTTNKSSPLVDFYKKSMSTSDIAKAYGIWLKYYRVNV